MIVIKDILVATDFGEPSAEALRYGFELAKQFRSRLHLLHVVEDLGAHPYAVLPGTLDPDELQPELEKNARANLAALLPDSDVSGVNAKKVMVVSRSPAQAILSYARDHEVDLIIVGTHGRRGLERVLLGSVARHVAGSAECPVLTVRAHERGFVRFDAEPASAQVHAG